MAASIRERQRNNPALYLNEVYRYILRDDSLLESLRSRGKDANCSKETLIQEVADWIHAEQDDLPEADLLRIKAVIASVASSLPTVLQGASLWTKWRSLLQDIFFWFEYLYEDSAGATSAWQLSAFCSAFSHATNVRIPMECRAFYEEKMCLKDSHGINRGEIIKTLAFDQAALERENAMLTTSQSAVISMGKINQHLASPTSSLAESCGEEADEQPAPGHGVPQYVSEECGRFEVGPMRDGEMVVRFFGMKAEDDQFMSGNILVHEVQDPPVGRARSRSRGKAGAAELASYGLAIGRSVLGKALVVHAGFWKTFQSLNRGCVQTFGVDLPERIMNQWQQQQLEHPDVKKRRLVITGHSMGGAFACFAAFCLHARYRQTHPELVDGIVLVLIGSPKFARLRFTNWINAHFAGRVVRLELEGDNIVDLPPLPGWFAPGNRLLLSRQPMEQAISSVGEEVMLDSHHFSYWNVIRHASIHFTLTPNASANEFKIPDVEFRKLVAAGDVDSLLTVDPAILRATVEAYSDQYNQGALHVGAASGSVPMLALLLEQGAKINKRDNCFWTPLHRACNDAQWEAALFLIGHGAVVDACSDSDSTPMIYVCQHPATSFDWDGPHRVLEALFTGGANVLHRNQNGDCPLVRAIKAVQHTGCLSTVHWLLEHGASVSPEETTMRHPAGFTALHCAVMTGNREVISLLLKAGADPHYRIKSARDFYFKSAYQLALHEKPDVFDVFKE